jgi:hypothetical protein
VNQHIGGTCDLGLLVVRVLKPHNLLSKTTRTAAAAAVVVVVAETIPTETPPPPPLLLELEEMYNCQFMNTNTKLK